MVHIRTKFRSDDGERVIQAETMTQPTRLYTHNVDVDSINGRELKHLSGDEMTYEMETKGNPNLVDILKKSCLAPELLSLKKGAKVMFVKNNFETGYANGTLGIVKEIEGFSGGPVVETLSGKLIDVPVESWVIEEDGKIKAELKQYPLRLAWAITVHKSQGMSLDAVEVDLSKAFEKGMGYVALSRVRSWSGLTILGFHSKALAVDAEVLLYDKQLQTLSDKVKRELYEMSEEGVLAKRQHDFIHLIAPAHVFEDVDEKGIRIKKKKEKPVKVTTFQKTHQFLKEQIPLKEIAKHRDMTEDTILNHIEKLLEEKAISLADIDYIRKSFSAKKFDDISTSLKFFHSQNDDFRLGPVKNALGPNVSYRDIQLVRLFIKK
jgi:hypothetical protein